MAKAFGSRGFVNGWVFGACTDATRLGGTSPGRVWKRPYSAPDTGGLVWSPKHWDGVLAECLLVAQCLVLVRFKGQSLRHPAQYHVTPRLSKVSTPDGWAHGHVRGGKCIVNMERLMFQAHNGLKTYLGAPKMITGEQGPPPPKTFCPKI